MAEAGVAPGAVIHNAEGEDLGANQEILQLQAQGEVVVNIMNLVLIWIGFDVVANRQALRSEIAEIRDIVDPYRKGYHRVAGVVCEAYSERWPSVFRTPAHQTTQGHVALGTGLRSSQPSSHTRRPDSGVIQSSYFYSSTESGYPEKGGERRQFRFQ